MSTIVLLIPTGVVLLLIVDWLRVVRLYGGSRMAAFRLMIATLWASQSRWLIFAATISTLSTAYLASNPLFWANVPPAVVVVLFSVPFSALVVVLRTPAVLFLGSSEFSQELYQQLRLHANHYRVVAFFAQPNDQIGFLALQSDGLRTRTTDWAYVVRRVAEAVPLVVIDTRQATPNIVKELRWLIVPARRDRVILVAMDNGALPVLACLGMPVSTTGLHVTRANECVSAVRNRLRSIALAPTPLPGLLSGTTFNASSDHLKEKAGRRRRQNARTD